MFSRLLSMFSLHTRQLWNVKFAPVWVRVCNWYKNLHKIEYQIVWTRSYNYMLPRHDKLVKILPFSCERSISMKLCNDSLFYSYIWMIISPIPSDQWLAEGICPTNFWTGTREVGKHYCRGQWLSYKIQCPLCLSPPVLSATSPITKILVCPDFPH